MWPDDSKKCGGLMIHVYTTYRPVQVKAYSLFTVELTHLPLDKMAVIVADDIF